VFSHPGHPETARLVDAAPDLGRALARLGTDDRQKER